MCFTWKGRVFESVARGRAAAFDMELEGPQNVLLLHRRSQGRQGWQTWLSRRGRDELSCSHSAQSQAGFSFCAAPARRRPRLPPMVELASARQWPRLPAWPRLVRGVLHLEFHRHAWGLKGGVLRAIKARGRIAVLELEGAAAERCRRALAASQERGRQERQTWLRISFSFCARRRAD